MEPDGPPTIKPWMIGVGVAVLVVGYYLYKSRQASSSSGSTLNTAAYGPPATGTGVLEPIVINSGAGGTSSATAPTSTVGNTSGGASPVPAGTSAQTGGPTNGLGGLSPNSYYALSPNAARAALNTGMVVYQSGQNALDWAQKNGGSTAGIDPNAYYALSPTAANTILNSGGTVYQSGYEAQSWASQHPSQAAALGVG